MVVDESIVLSRIIATLNANPGVYSDTVSGNVGAFPSDQEIIDAMFEADEYIANFGYFQSVNRALAKDFLVLSNNLSNGDDVPFMHGEPQKIEVSDDGTEWRKGVEAASVDDITNAFDVGNSYVGANSFNFLYFLDTGNFYTTSTYGRIEYPQYTKGAELQCRQSEEFLLICTTIRMLVKNASPAPFENYIGESVRGVEQLVTDGTYTKQAVNQ